MLTPAEVGEFEHTGLLTLRQAVPPARVAEMRDALWDFLAAKHGRRRDDPRSWQPISGRSGVQALTKAGAFAAARDAVTPYADHVLGRNAWKQPAHWGHPLVTFPNTGAQWDLPVSAWHVDSHQWSSGAVPGLVVFTFLEEARPRGGGTLVVSGSHQLTWRLSEHAGGFVRTSEMKAALGREDSWFADLWSGSPSDSDRREKYLARGAVVDGVVVRVVELCGEPGDVVLMNPRCFHAPSPNTGTSPRMMLSDFLDRGADERG